MKENDFIKFLEELQKKIEYDQEKTYSKKVLNEYKNPSNFGLLENPNAFGEIKGPCGDTMKISLKIEKEKIKEAYFWTDGCGATIACGSMLTKIIKQKNLQTVKNISSSQLLNALDGLPAEHHHCSVLAINTLKKAVKNYMNKNKISVKKF